MPKTHSELYANPLTLVPRLFKQLSILFDAAKAAVQRPLARPKNSDSKLPLPRIDIFIPCCGEDIDVVLDTATAACVQKFPNSLFRVIVLDDGRSTQLKDAILSLRISQKFPHLYYASRNADVSTHSKAANLNFGLSFASTLPGSSADYFSVLDCDMIPSSHWLRTVLDSLLHEPIVGLVCAIQRYYNIPQADPLGMTHEIAHIDSLGYMQNAAQEAWCGGTGFIVRTTALQQIGAFPESQLSEDLVTSLLLSAAGWKTLCVIGPLQWGLAPDTMAGWIKQRQRWAAGLISMGHFACSSRARKIPTIVRIRAFLWGAVDTWNQFVWTLAMVIFPLAVMTGKPLLPNHHLRLQLRLAMLDFILQSICHYLLSSLIDFRMSILEHISAFWRAPLNFAIACRCIVPLLLGRPLPPFKPTGLPTTGDSERAARKKGTSFLKVALWECGAWFHTLCLLTCVAGIGTSTVQIVGIFRSTNNTASSTSQNTLPLPPFQTTFDNFILRIGWPPLFLLLIAILKSAWIPIAYAISPPPLRDRKELLCESTTADDDDDTGVRARYPTERVKAEFMKRASQSFWGWMAVVYLVVFVVTEMSWSSETSGMMGVL